MSFGVGNAIGVIVGGVFGHYAYKRDVRYPPIIMGTSLILAVVPTYFLVNWVEGGGGSNESNVSAVVIVGLLAGILAVIPVPLERAIPTNVTVPESRGRANSCLTVIDDLGKGLGPVWLLLSSSGWTGRQRSTSAFSDGLLVALSALQCIVL